MSKEKWFVVWEDGEFDEWGVSDGYKTEKQALEDAKKGATRDGGVHFVVKATKRVGPKEMPVEITEVD